MNHFFVPNMQYQFLGQQISMRRHDEERTIDNRELQKRQQRHQIVLNADCQRKKRLCFLKNKQRVK